MKTCTKCKVEKELNEFGRDKHKKDGLKPWCRQCKNEAQRAKRAKESAQKKADFEAWLATDEGIEHLRQKREFWLARHRENQAKHRRRNPESVKASQARYRESSKAKVNAKNSARYAAKLKRTPLWADLVEIDYAYHAAQVIKDVYGTSWDVDHIIPLQGENVSGLHVQGNLQIMPPSQNRSKGNSFTC